MGVQEELKQFMELIMNHTDDIEYLNLSIKLKNGNRINYNVDRKKEMKLFEKEKKKQGKKNTTPAEDKKS